MAYMATNLPSSSLNPHIKWRWQNEAVLKFRTDGAFFLVALSVVLFFALLSPFSFLLPFWPFLLGGREEGVCQH